MDGVNADFLNNLITQILTAAQGGTKLDIHDTDAIGQYVCTVLVLGAGLIPVIGSSLGALCSLFGAIVFSPNSMEEIWDALRERIEELIDMKISEFYLNTLKQKILGLQGNLNLYRQYLQDFEDAETEKEKEDAAATLKSTHISFLSVVIASVPEFQLEPYTVPSLPLFSLVANIHLTLLADGIARGKGWGYTDRNIETMKAQFASKTSPPTKSVPGGHKGSEDVLLPGSTLKEAIKEGTQAGVPSEVLETWREAYAILYEAESAPKNGDADLDYVTYAKKIYAQGRNDVKPYTDNDRETGGPEADKYRAIADYDSGMVLNVLNYTELWPFMTGDEFTASAKKNLNREIFYGPFGRYTDNTSWSPSSPPPVTDARAPITDLNVRAWDDIDGLQVKHGSSWDGFQGSPFGGAPKQIDLAWDEYVTSVDVWYGHKLGKLKFVTNKSKQLENGNARHAEHRGSAAPPGYELTSVTITRWVGHIPPGCEGVILGFRPLMMDTTRG